MFLICIIVYIAWNPEAQKFSKTLQMKTICKSARIKPNLPTPLFKFRFENWPWNVNSFLGTLSWAGKRVSLFEHVFSI